MRHGRGVMRFRMTGNPRLDLIKNSFVYKTCSEWNELEYECRSALSLNSFKRLLCGVDIPSMPTLRENPRFVSVIYTRLKSGCSSLNNDLFHANIVASALCECRVAPETLFHYMYDCPFHDVPRLMLMFKLTELGLQNLSLDVLFHCDAFHDKQISLDVQNAIYYYIMATRRFE